MQIGLAVYLVLASIVFLFIWLPEISRLNAEIWRTSRMITMIPLEIINKTTQIKMYLRKIVRG